MAGDYPLDIGLVPLDIAWVVFASSSEMEILAVVSVLQVRPVVYRGSADTGLLSDLHGALDNLHQGHAGVV